MEEAEAEGGGRHNPCPPKTYRSATETAVCHRWQRTGWGGGQRESSHSVNLMSSFLISFSLVQIC